MKIAYRKFVLVSVLLSSVVNAFATTVNFTHNNIFSSPTSKSENDVGSSCRTVLKHLNAYSVTYSVVKGIPTFTPAPTSNLFFDAFVEADPQHYISILRYSGADGVQTIVPVIASHFLGSSASISFGSCQTTARLS